MAALLELLPIAAEEHAARGPLTSSERYLAASAAAKAAAADTSASAAARLSSSCFALRSATRLLRSFSFSRSFAFFSAWTYKHALQAQLTHNALKSSKQ